MAVRYTIDVDRRIVTTMLSDVLSFRECVEHHTKLGADPLFSPDYCELLDGRLLRRVSLQPSGIFSLSRSCPYGPKAVRAICTGSNLLNYGIARMFQSMSASKHGEIEIFAEHIEAMQWLESKTLFPDTELITPF